MGVKRYLNIKNWYSNEIILLMEFDEKKEIIKPSLKRNHTIVRVNECVVEDTLAFDGKQIVKEYHEFLRNGDIGVFGYVDGIPAGRLWGQIAPCNVREGSLNLGLEKDSIFVHYVKTAKAFRNQGLCSEMLYFLLEQCKGSKLYVTINLKNTPSLRVHKKLGFKEVAVLRIERRCMKIKTIRHDLG